MTPAGVILDFDGVIADSLSLHLAAWSAATEVIFRKPLPEPETLIGHATRTIAGIVAKRLGDPSQAADLVRVKNRLVVEGIERLAPLSGALALVAELGRLKLPFGIASNSQKAFVHAAVARFGISVPVILCGDEVPRGKPNPGIYLECGRRMGFTTPEARAAVVVFEDSVHGLAAAKAAGMVPIGVTTEQPAARLSAGGAVLTCRSLGEALAQGWLEKLPL